jgi:hypothetical protein
MGNGCTQRCTQALYPNYRAQASWTLEIAVVKRSVGSQNGE